mgnify:CR=1 FL=1
MSLSVFTALNSDEYGGKNNCWMFDGSSFNIFRDYPPLLLLAHSLLLSSDTQRLLF